ncbi:MAG: energy-coupling factor transporter ATPase [Erysipelotrichaceae bacterium]|nr:energy-coupling factor transporter ATPase [Erysipelotrichaceae bacterium]
MDAIQVQDVKFSYDGETDVINGMSFSIPKGSYTTIIGHNGSGKSTIAKLLNGLLEAREGSIEILGREMNLENLQEIRDNIGIVFQNPDNQFIGSTVADDIAFGLENHCVPAENMQEIIEESARKVGMLKYLDYEPANLSGGQKQRVAIAGLLAVSPSIIVFDESTSMLDPQGKASINRQIKELNKMKDKTIVSITHDMDEVAQSEHVIVLKDGKAVLEGTPAEIFEKEKLLQEMGLDVPFALKASRAFQKAGVMKKDCLNLTDVVEAVCPSK